MTSICLFMPPLQPSSTWSSFFLAYSLSLSQLLPKMPFHLPPIVEYRDPDSDVYMYIFSNLSTSLTSLIAFLSLAYLIYLVAERTCAPTVYQLPPAVRGQTLLPICKIYRIHMVQRNPRMITSFFCFVNTSNKHIDVRLLWWYNKRIWNLVDLNICKY